MPNLNSLLDEHVVLKYECLDRIFLHAYVAKLQEPDQLWWFLCRHRGEPLPRYEILGAMTRHFVAAVERMAAERQIPVVHFERGQRKEAIAAPYFAKAEREGVVLIGIAQEWAKVFRAPSKGQRPVGKYAATRNSAFVNHIYFYILDADWGPSFIKICTFAPWGMRVWLNGHQWLRRQLERRRIAYQPLDNGVGATDDGAALERLCQRLSAAHLQRYFDRWLYRLPNPFTRQDRRAGYTYQLSLLQLEVSRTEVFDRPLHGRQFFEEVIKDQLDLGRPERMQLVFGRRIPRRRGAVPSWTRVCSRGVDPSLQISHRNTHVKQYWKCDRALRTETTFNNTYDFGIGRKLENLPKLFALGRDINRRLLEMERQSCRAAPAASLFESLVMPTGESGRRAPGLRFGDPRVVALFGALCQFRIIFGGFYAKDLRPLVEHHLGAPYTMGQLAYDLRRLIRKGLLERLPRSNRYRLTPAGRRLLPFCTKLYQRVFCRGIARLQLGYPAGLLNLAWRRYEVALEALITEAQIAA
jgi:hypothetical protein